MNEKQEEKEMSNALDSMIINAQCRMARTKERVRKGFREFWSAEKGVSNVVATIIILLIVVLLIGIFWDRLQEWLDDMMNTIFGSSFTADGLTP